MDLSGRNVGPNPRLDISVEAKEPEIIKDMALCSLPMCEYWTIPLTVCGFYASRFERSL